MRRLILIAALWPLVACGVTLQPRFALPSGIRAESPVTDNEIDLQPLDPIAIDFLANVDQFIVPRPPTTSNPNCTPDQSLTTGSAIQTALSNASAGATICLPQMDLTLTSTITATVATNVTLMGQTTCTGTMQSIACTDLTTIRNNTGGKMYDLGINPSGIFRSSGVTYRSVTCVDDPFKLYASSGTYANARIDHNHWINFCNVNFMFGNIRGVSDHNFYDNPGSGISTANQVRAFGADNDTEWTNPTNFGSKDYNWFYFEDSRWIRGISNDCYSSGRQVFRYNHMSASGIQEHGTGHSGQNRGCRGMEAYGNTIIGDDDSSRTAAVAIYTGSGMVFNNTADFTCTNCSNAVLLDLVETRQSDYTYGVLLTNRQPAGYSICGTNFDGTATVWDGNQDSSGYPCLDQVGRGPGDLLSSDFSTKANSTRGCTVNFTWANRGSNCDNSDSSANPRQALEPVYEWLNTLTGGSGNWVGVFRDSGSGGGGISNIAANRDYYSHHGNTNCNAGAGSCTAGVGSGTLAQIPANCTTGVAYWATDTNGLYKCVSTNVWSWYYSPLTYPHPNQGSLPSNNYATNFPTTENPIAEQNSVWTNGHDAGSSCSGFCWGNVQIGSANFAYGVDEPTQFGDPTAILKGTWSATQGAQAIVKINTTNANLNTSGSREVEVRLRSTVSAASISGYECYCSVKPNDPYCHIASWGGPNGQFVNMDDGTDHGDGTNSNPYSYTAVEGDTLSCTVSGTLPTTIKLYINGILRMTVFDNTDDFTFPDSNHYGPWTSGNPGIGMYNSSGANFNWFGLSKFSAYGQ